MNEPENVTVSNSSTPSAPSEAVASNTPETSASAVRLPFYAPIQEALAETERQIQQELSSSQPKLETIFSQSRLLAGKRLRPALTLLCAQACGALVPQHITCATVMELIHTASLVHDDVLDEAELRRHNNTINARWDNELAVLFGDLIVSRAMKLASSLEDFQTFNLITRTCEKLCEGELLQVANRGTIDLGEDVYYKIIEGKTAALIECSCRLGAKYAGVAPEVVESFGNFGLHLGTAFQIVDDLLDVSGSEQTVGKTLGQDIKKQKATLAIIYAMQCISEQKRSQILAELQVAENPAEYILPWLKRTNAIEFARKAAQTQIDKAIASIQEFSCPESGAAALQSLKDLAQFVLARKY